MPNITREDREQFSVTNCFLSDRAQMKANKNVLAHAILLRVMGRLNVARLSTDRDNSTGEALKKRQGEICRRSVEIPQLTHQYGRVIATTETT